MATKQKDSFRLSDIFTLMKVNICIFLFFGGGGGIIFNEMMDVTIIAKNSKHC